MPYHKFQINRLMKLQSDDIIYLQILNHLVQLYSPMGACDSTQKQKQRPPSQVQKVEEKKEKTKLESKFEQKPEKDQIHPMNSNQNLFATPQNQQPQHIFNRKNQNGNIDSKLNSNLSNFATPQHKRSSEILNGKNQDEGINSNFNRYTNQPQGSQHMINDNPRPKLKASKKPQASSNAPRTKDSKFEHIENRRQDKPQPQAIRIPVHISRVEQLHKGFLQGEYVNPLSLNPPKQNQFQFFHLQQTFFQNQSHFSIPRSPNITTSSQVNHMDQVCDLPKRQVNIRATAG